MRMRSVDTVVVGLGVMGASTLGVLASRGLNPLGLEQYWAGHPFGSSHGESRIIRQAYYEHPDYVPLVQEAWQAWRALERSSGWPLLTETGGLMVGRPDSELIRGALRSAIQHHLPHERLEASALMRRFPAFRVDPDDVGVYEPRAGVLIAERATEALVAEACRQGAAVQLGQRVRQVAPEGGGVVVHTDQGSIRARCAVVAAGPWTRELLPEWNVPLVVERQAVTWLRAQEPRWFHPDRFPVYMREEASGDTFYGFPSLDAATVKLARHHGGATTTPDRVARHVDADDLAVARRFAARTFPGLLPTVAQSTVCLYTDTPDRHFAVGPLSPDVPQIVVLAGFSGHGFKFGPAIGRIAADLLATPGSGPALFRPDRFIGA